MTEFSHLCCIVDLTIIQATKDFFHVALIVELKGGSVAMFTTNSKEKIGLGIPAYSLFCCKLIKCDHCMKNTDPALDDVQDVCKCGTDIGGNLEDSWLRMGRDYGWREGYSPQVCETWIIPGTMIDMGQTVSSQSPCKESAHFLLFSEVFWMVNPLCRCF